MRRTKIVCTIGPSSSKQSDLERLVRGGMDVARLNFSHGTHEEHLAVLTKLRDISRKQDRAVAILQDLSGPKVRLGNFGAPLVLKKGQEVAFSLNAYDPIAYIPLLPLPLPELMAAFKPGDKLLIDDGTIGVRVTKCEGEGDERRVITKCFTDGEIKPRKGVTAPGVKFKVRTVTPKDLEDLEFGLKAGVDWVASSYVRCAEDLNPLFELMEKLGIRAPIIAKIENAEAVANLNEILARVDGIMVARGDMGVEMPFDEVPLIQKRIIRACNRAGKPVITATQMLESMMDCPRPTRAEATDVANAILDGTDAVMLSGETAAGRYPHEAVQTLVRIARRTETALFHDKSYETRLAPARGVTTSVTRAAANIAEEVNAKLILCATSSGSTAMSVSKHRPDVPIIGITSNVATYRRLALTWGVEPALIGAVSDTDSMVQRVVERVVEMGRVREGDRVVITSGSPINNPGSTNLIKVHTIGQPLHAIS